ncbi:MULTISPECIES: DotD/TraH family lipoprotein [Cysteiniphilum]|uniref:DotD/TraH family lipoprotein n=1 Tax=Cysteiniphilum TaxID=2056696 RepID=UPI001786E29D|nr:MULTISPECIES: DotD/TraH family lipoprotein [Cysteiniphilum]
MKGKLFLLSMITVLASGCASTSNQSIDLQAEQVEINGFMLKSLDQSAQTISQSVNTLNTYNAMRFPKVDLPLAQVPDGVLSQKVTLVWNGPIQPVIEKLAKIAGFTFQVYGNPPAIPIVIVLNQANDWQSILDTLRSIDVQTKGGASIYVNAKEKIISLRYQ